MNLNDGNLCGDCAYYLSTVVGKGECRWSPPSVTLFAVSDKFGQAGMKVMTAYPAIKSADVGCSEHSERGLQL